MIFRYFSVSNSFSFKLLPLGITLLLSSAAQSEQEPTYQYSGFVEYTRGKLDGSVIDYDAKAYKIGGTINFNRLNFNSGYGPLAEIEFIERASNISFEYEDGDGERELPFFIPSKNVTTLRWASKTNDFITGIKDWAQYEAVFRWASKTNDFTAGAEYIYSDVEGIDINDFRLRGGYFVGKLAEVGVEYRNISIDGASLDDAHIYLIDFKYLETNTSRGFNEARTTSLVVDAAIGMQDIDSSTDFVWEAEITAYLTSYFGVGFGFYGSDDGIDNETAEFSLRWFITPKIDLNLMYSETESGISDIKFEEISTDIGFRF